MHRVVVAAALYLVVGYLTVFLLTGARPEADLVGVAVANALAAVVAGVPVAWLCQRVPWRHAGAWWFLPLHAIGALLFVLVWHAATALLLGAWTGLTGGAWTPVPLMGAARSWLGLTAAILYVAVAGGSYAVQGARAAHRAAALQHAAEMHAMRAQLDPHLLFNTLHSLLELVRGNDAHAEEAIERFARLTRYVAEGRDAPATVPLRDEWAMLEDYVVLEQLRLGPRLSVTRSLAAPAAMLDVPALTLQPLVENAIRHGIAPRAGPGTVHVSASVSVRGLELVVEDDGLGADATTHGQGVGLTLVRKRLEARYGQALSFVAGPRAPTGWRVHAILPVRPPA